MMVTPTYDLSTKVSDRLKDHSGASIVIALVFFLICAVVGSVVITAASINAQALSTHRDTQQAEYTVGSAAQLVAQQLAPKQTNPTTIAWGYEGESKTPTSMTWTGDTPPQLLQQIWEGTTSVSHQFNAIWDKRKIGENFYLGGSEASSLTIAAKATANTGLAEVYAWVSIDRDFNITVKLSTNEDRTIVAAYDQTVTARCVPTYDQEGKLTACQWSQATITKAAPSVSGE